MKTTVNKYQFRRAFEEMNRTNNFTYAGLNALFEYLEQYEEDTGEEIELDVIAICCDFTEYKNLTEFKANYGNDYQSIEDIEDRTIVIHIDDESFIIQDF